MVALHSPLVRSVVSSTWESVSSSSSCGTALSSLARGNHPRRSCRPHRTRRCQSPPQPQGKLCLGKLLSAWRWRTPRGCGLLGPPRSQAVVTEREKEPLHSDLCKWRTHWTFLMKRIIHWIHTCRIYIFNLHNWTLHSCGTWDRHQRQTVLVSYNVECSSCWVWPWSRTGP